MVEKGFISSFKNLSFGNEENVNVFNVNKNLRESIFRVGR